MSRSLLILGRRAGATAITSREDTAMQPRRNGVSEHEVAFTYPASRCEHDGLSIPTWIGYAERSRCGRVRPCSCADHARSRDHDFTRAAASLWPAIRASNV